MISPKTLKLKDKESSARLVQFDCSVSVNSRSDATPQKTGRSTIRYSVINVNSVSRYSVINVNSVSKLYKDLNKHRKGIHKQILSMNKHKFRMNNGTQIKNE